MKSRVYGQLLLNQFLLCRICGVSHILTSVNTILKSFRYNEVSVLNKVRNMATTPRHIASNKGIQKTSFDLPASLKTSFKLKTVVDETDMKTVIIRLIQAYIDEKIKLNEI
jgi:hypothetical protein